MKRETERPPTYMAVIKVENGYVLCDNDRLVPSQVCGDWDSVVHSMHRFLHPEDHDRGRDAPRPPASITPEAMAAASLGVALDELLTAADLAEKLRASMRLVRQWTKEGMPHLPVGRTLRYRQSECEHWLMEQAREKRRLKSLTAGLHPMRTEGDVGNGKSRLG